ncbi:MAG: hypothetical protein IT323_13920 [Anaerolineae bacterium]|nr:hypothetical protein [Anaerolineae bacterium]
MKRASVREAGQGWRREPVLAARSLAMLVIVILIAGCAAALDPVLPTLAPSQTPPPLPTSPPVRTAPTIPTLPPTPTRIVPPSATPGPSPTAIAGAAGGPLALVVTATESALIPGALRIDYFTTDAVDVSPGDTVTLYWLARGTERATIYRVQEDGARGESWSVGRFGSFQVRVRPGARQAERFLLVAGDSPSEVQQTLTIPLGCEGAWFFEPNPGGCPPGPPVISTMAEQVFERGRMFWVQAQGQIYVLYDDGDIPGWSAFPDQFQEGGPELDPNRQPPEGLSQPVRGFGLVWREQPRVADRLGWATGPETAYDGALQGDTTLETGVAYLRGRDDTIYELSGGGARWQRYVPPSGN